MNISNINLFSYSFNIAGREHEWCTRNECQKKGLYFQWIETDPQAFMLRNNCLGKQTGQHTQSISFIGKKLRASAQLLKIVVQITLLGCN